MTLLPRSLRHLRAVWAKIGAHPLTREARGRAALRYLELHVAGRARSRPRIYPFLDGVRFLARPGMAGIVGNVIYGLHDYEDMAFLLHALRPGDLFVDVGANVGAYTLLAAGAVGAEVVAFEPVPESFHQLTQNVRLNGLSGRVDARREGVGARVETLRFTSDKGTMNRVASAEQVGRGIAVPSAPLDGHLQRVPWMLKIDVEGYEGAVLDGAAATLAPGDLKAILIELNGSGGRYGIEDDALDARLRDHGFRPFRYDPVKRRLEPLEGWRRDQFNTLYLRDLGLLRERVSGAPHFRVRGHRV